MIRYILSQWKTRKVTVMLIIFGFFIGSVVMSVGTSLCVQTYQEAEDMRQGDLEKQMRVSLHPIHEEGWEQENVVRLVEKLGTYGNIQLLSMPCIGNAENGEAFSVVPVWLKNEPQWHVPLIDGEYLTTADMKEEVDVVVIGKTVAQKYNVQVGDTIELEGRRYSIKGICGRDNRETAWQYAIYMPLKSYISHYPKCFEEEDMGLSVHLEKSMSEMVQEQKGFEQFAESLAVRIMFHEMQDEVDDSDVTSALLLTTIATVLVFIIGVLNVVHLMLYWVLERKRTFGIMKALGAPSWYMSRVIVLEVLAMATIGCVLAMAAQSLVEIGLMEVLKMDNISLEISWVNCVCTLGVALFFALLSAIMPARYVLGFDPVEVIGSE